jgi:GDP/UDP-N,N'-diacetylbacillosamine 2-epimerase (hydrolysing)
MKQPRRILVALESRATFGYSVNVIRRMMADSAIEVQTLVCGMHLMPEMGNTVETITMAGIPVSARVPLSPGPGPGGWPRAMGQAIVGFTDAYERLKPDIVLISGDRAETFAIAVAAVYMGLPVAHIQAGDKSGHIDDAARMALAKLVHVHLAPGADARDRLRRLGEEEFRIFDVGAPQLDDMVGRDFRVHRVEIDGRTFDLSQRYLILLQHPVFTEHEAAQEQIEETVHACSATGLPIVWIYPNSDLGYLPILDVIRARSRNPQVTIAPNLDRESYLALLANAACLVGNSSSGILEAPTFQTPVVNIGNRQRGRPQASNIINCGYQRGEIALALSQALHDETFLAACRRAVNPFGDGQSAPRIAQALRDITIDRRLLDKQTTY